MTYTQPSPRELKQMVLALIEQNPERHDQAFWLSNAFDWISDSPVDKIRALLWQPIPETKLDPDGLCGTRACVAGWGGIMGSPPGTRIIQNVTWDVRLRYPDGTEEEISAAAQRLMELTDGQADWLFDSSRTRAEVTEGLALLISDPDASYEDLRDLEEQDEDDEDW